MQCTLCEEQLNVSNFTLKAHWESNGIFAFFTEKLQMKLNIYSSVLCTYEAKRTRQLLMPVSRQRHLHKKVESWINTEYIRAYLPAVCTDPADGSVTWAILKMPLLKPASDEIQTRSFILYGMALTWIDPNWIAQKRAIREKFNFLHWMRFMHDFFSFSHCIDKITLMKRANESNEQLLRAQLKSYYNHFEIPYKIRTTYSDRHCTAIAIAHATFIHTVYTLL